MVKFHPFPPKEHLERDDACTYCGRTWGSMRDEPFVFGTQNLGWTGWTDPAGARPVGGYVCGPESDAAEVMES